MIPAQPTQFGPYRISARLAAGGMAEVYLGRRVEDGRAGPMVALKRLLPHLREDPAVVRMFLNEARITAQIDHPNVVRILEVGDHDGEPFIAMELLEGSSFAQLREKAAEAGKRVPLGVALRVLIEACRGLDAAHRATDDQGHPLFIVHRDFTPDNIHVGVNGAVKVLDFGIAKSSGTPGGTEPGTLKGKYFYMSPEMISGEPVDYRADVFAAGVMLYEQLCGHRPFTGHTTAAILARISEDAPRRPTELDPSVPRALEAVCLRALSRDPAQRFDSLAALAIALESIPEAPPADPHALATYVGALFPPETDPRRAQVERARAMDPSHPPHPRPSVAASSAPRMGARPSDPPAAAVARAPAPETRSSAAVSPVNEVASWTTHKPARATRRFVAAGVAFLGLVAAAGGGAWYWSHRPPPLSPAERIARARQQADAKARLDLVQLSEDPRATAAQLAEAGGLLLSAHANRAALELATGFGQRFPQSEDAPLIEARAAIALHVGKRAEAALDRAARLAPHDPRPEVVRADLKMLQGDLSGALAAIEEARRDAPQDRQLVVRQADLLVRLNRLDEAQAITTEALDRRFTPEIAAERAFIALQQGKPRDAESLLRRALQQNPRLAAAHYYLGAALEADGKSGEAEREYREADRLGPDDTRALQALIALCTRTHQEDEAKRLNQLLQARTAEAE